MPDQLAEPELRERGLSALEQELGPTQALRLLTLLSREPFDYQTWQRKTFDGMSLSEVLSQAKALQS